MLTWIVAAQHRHWLEQVQEGKKKSANLQGDNSRRAFSMLSSTVAQLPPLPPAGPCPRPCHAPAGPFCFTLPHDCCAALLVPLPPVCCSCCCCHCCCCDCCCCCTCCTSCTSCCCCCCFVEEDGAEFALGGGVPSPLDPAFWVGPVLL